MSKEELRQTVADDMLRLRAVSLAFHCGLRAERAAYLLGVSYNKVRHIYRAIKAIERTP
jgi:hypothetical protein